VGWNRAAAEGQDTVKEGDIESYLISFSVFRLGGSDIVVVSSCSILPGTTAEMVEALPIL
jgi:hypothetical protein